jgi:hypothetical protein
MQGIYSLKKNAMISEVRWVFAKLGNTQYTRLVIELGPADEDYEKTEEDIHQGATGVAYPIINVVKGRKYFKFSSQPTFVPIRMDGVRALRARTYLQSIL